QRILDSEDAIPSRSLDVFEKLFGRHHALAIVSETHCIVFQALAGFLNCFGEASPDCHHFSHALHLQSEYIITSFELVEVPAWNLHNHIVKCGFEISGGSTCDLILEFVECITYRELCSNLCDGIACSFGCQC